MNRSCFTGKKIRGTLNGIPLTCAVIIFSLLQTTGLQAQKKEKIAKPLNTLSIFSTSNRQIWANVEGSTGLVQVLLPPGNWNSGSLDFPDHSYFSCSISGTYYTNNATIDIPPSANAKLLQDGNTIKIVDTIRTTWANRNGVDIIQDIYPVLFSKSGQIVYKWKFRNTNGAPVNVGCQYLQDIQISDPSDKKIPHSNDGPIILTKWSYDPLWQQYPDFTGEHGIPTFYIGFLHDLPNIPSFVPNLSGQGYMDYPFPPLNLIKPSKVTIGEWYTMTQSIFGADDHNWHIGSSYGTTFPIDNAILLEFPIQGIPAGNTVEIGRTSYGTGEYELCNGQLFSVVFYPHHLVWTKSNNPPPGYYTPNPIHIEKFVVNAPTPNTYPSAGTKITLTVGDDMTISDSLCNANYGNSQEQPTSGPGLNLSPGGVGYFDWWVCTKPSLFCTGADIDSLIFTGKSSWDKPPFIDKDGEPECVQLITIDCAETDQDPPLFSDTVYDCHSTSLVVSDSRPTDKGLRSITWVPEKGTDAKKIIVSDPVPPITPCYFDTIKHIITITKVDSTSKGCFDFTFTDCFGHQSYTTICVKECPLVPHPDSLPPVFTLIKKWGAYDASPSCDNNRIDSFMVTDDNKYDSGICKLDTIPGSVVNMHLAISPFSPGSGLVRFSVSVLDSMKDGDICLRATDCSKEVHFTDTCIHYCTIKDTLAPRITILQTGGDIWHVTVVDSAAWDRLIDTIFIVNATPNITPNGPVYLPVSDTKGASNFEFDVKSLDTTKISSFCIEANDLAGNRSPAGAYCVRKGISQDSLCPNILIEPLLTTNPTSITVNVNDIHFIDPPTDTIKYVWDSGIDKVFFTNNKGMKLPVPNPIFGNGASRVPQFQISVIDTTKIDTVACVTINATDMNGNTCSATYCYPYTPDTLPPVITLRYDPTDKSQIFGLITDNTSADRGLDSIWLFHNVGEVDTNLNWKSVKLQGTKQYTIDASNSISRDPLQSSVGAMWAIDRWGAFYSPISVAHTAKVNFAIWVQDFEMLHGVQPKQGESFAIPVYFIKNDSIPVLRKAITDFTIGFTMIRDANVTSNPIVFDSASSIKTDMERVGWNKPQWIVSPSGTSVVISGSMSSGTPLDALPLLKNSRDSLVMLYFHAVPNDSTRKVILQIDSITLNKGRDSLYAGTVSPVGISTALMPAPYGSLSGGVVVITGACSPQLLTDNTNPSSVSLDPPRPNPFSHTTTFEYTVAEDGPVRFVVYDMLGQEIKTIVNDFQKQGHYTVTFDGSSLGSGNYVARLQAGGVVRSRRIGVEK
jgi:hypothetical protein